MNPCLCLSLSLSSVSFPYPFSFISYSLTSRKLDKHNWHDFSGQKKPKLFFLIIFYIDFLNLFFWISVDTNFVITNNGNFTILINPAPHDLFVITKFGCSLFHKYALFSRIVQCFLFSTLRQKTHTHTQSDVLVSFVISSRFRFHWRMCSHVTRSSQS